MSWWSRLWSSPSPPSRLERFARTAPTEVVALERHASQAYTRARAASAPPAALGDLRSMQVRLRLVAMNYATNASMDKLRKSLAAIAGVSMHTPIAMITDLLGQRVDEYMAAIPEASPN